jgi:DNA polymerase I - 3'-5' exonuclease and polymerase domains
MKSFTAKGKPSVDEKTLGSIDIPFVKEYLKYKKLQKVLGTYLKGIHREVVDGYLHPFFNLHTTVTFRSSSDSPNFQNIPIRDKGVGEMIRTAIIPRNGRCLVELDYGGIEVKIAACYHKDPTMMEYLNDKTKDMHRDMAMECFKLKIDEVNKDIRYCGKNLFVFPQFYGDWWLSCSRNLWEAVGKFKLKTTSGTPLLEHLKKVGITRLGKQDPSKSTVPGTFEHHIKNVENNFWGKRFPVYAQWKKNWFNKYLERGWLKTKTGFICQGVVERNGIINYPIQGSAFHCLLWALINITKGNRKKRNEITNRGPDSR